LFPTINTPSNQNHSPGALNKKKLFFLIFLKQTCDFGFDFDPDTFKKEAKKKEAKRSRFAIWHLASFFLFF
jgi:hypothetical protein